MKTYSTDETVDAVVIGLGAGGAPLLARLAAAGLSVVALEAGPWHDPERDFATDEVAQNDLYWLDERLSAGENAIGFGANNSGKGVGGSTLHFTAYVPRAQKDDFLLKTESGVGEDWPIPFEEMIPYYEEVERTIGVSGPDPYPWGGPRGKGYPLPPLPLNGAALLMQKACAERGILTTPAPNAALSRPYDVEGVGPRGACTNRGFCQAGCNNRAKGSMDVTFVPLAVGAGAEIRPHSFVTEIELREGSVDAVVYVDGEGKSHRQRCRHLFLCAGAIETPRLLLLNGLANASGEVGKNFMIHVGVQVWGQFDAEIHPWKGIPGGLISEDTHRVKDGGFAGGYLLQSIGVMPVTYAQQFARATGRFGRDMADHMAGYNRVAGINVLGEGLPYAHNFLELSDEKDGRGLPKPRVHFTAGENEKRMETHAERLMRELWDSQGAKDVWSFIRYAHTIGTCRMGNDPARSVVDADGRSHEIPNLTISDNSTFPTSLAANPALTIMALSLRTADRFLSRG